MEENNWIALFKAVGGRDAGAMVSGAKLILDSGKRLQPDALRFLVASGMVGSLMQGSRRRICRAYSPPLHTLRAIERRYLLGYTRQHPREMMPSGRWKLIGPI